MENNQFNEQVKNKLEHHTVEPSAAVWDRIQAQLDKDAAAFDTGNLKRFWWFSAAMLTVATVLLAIWYSGETIDMVAYQATGNQSIQIPNKITTQDINNELVIDATSSESLIKNTPVLSQNTEKNKASVTSEPIEKVQPDTPVNSSDITADTGIPAEINHEEGSVSDLIEEQIVTANSDAPLSEGSLEATAELAVILDDQSSVNIEEPLSNNEDEANNVNESLEIAAVESAEENPLSENIENEDLTAIEPVEKVKKSTNNPFKGFYIGLNGGYYASTLLNSQNVVINDNPIETGVRFGPSKGLTLGYIFANNLSVQAEYLYNVIEGQNYYMEDVEGAVKSKAMTLYYDQVPLTFKLQTPRYNHLMKKPASVNILAGAQLNILKDYQIPQERRYDTDEDIFRPTNFSFLAGAEYQMLIKPHIMVSLGVQGTISENFSTSNDPLGDFQKHSLTTGAKGGVYYHF